MAIPNNKMVNKEFNTRARGLVHRNEEWIQSETGPETPYHEWYGILLYAYRQDEYESEEEEIGNDGDA